MFAKRPTRALLAAALVSFALAGVTASRAVADPGNGQGGGQRHDENPITLCHAHSSDTNPYKMITVDDDAVFQQGHDQHSHQGRMDIIPPFDYVVDGVTHHYPGQGDQSILANGCEVTPTPTTTSPAGTVQVWADKDWSQTVDRDARATLVLSGAGQSKTWVFDGKGNEVTNPGALVVPAGTTVTLHESSVTGYDTAKYTVTMGGDVVRAVTADVTLHLLNTATTKDVPTTTTTTPTTPTVPSSPDIVLPLTPPDEGVSPEVVISPAPVIAPAPVVQQPETFAQTGLAWSLAFVGLGCLLVGGALVGTARRPS